MDVNESWRITIIVLIVLLVVLILIGCGRRCLMKKKKDEKKAQRIPPTSTIRGTNAYADANAPSPKCNTAYQSQNVYFQETVVCNVRNLDQLGTVNTRLTPEGILIDPRKPGQCEGPKEAYEKPPPYNPDYM